MNKPEKASNPKDQKRETVFEAAAEAFAKYGFRRTTMNDIAELAGISRPALYLMFENKEDLFRELLSYRQKQAIGELRRALAQAGPWREAFANAILSYKRVLFEQVADSPHGEELIDNLSIAADLMTAGHDELVGILVEAIDQGLAAKEISFAATPMEPLEFVELLLTAMDGVKKSTRSMADFNRRTRQVVDIFLANIAAA